MTSRALASYSRWLSVKHLWWSIVAEWAFSHAVDAYADAEIVAERAETES